MVSYYSTADGSGSTSSGGIIGRIPATAGTWKTTVFSWTPPAEAKSFKLLLYASNTSIATLYWDNVKLNGSGSNTAPVSVNDSYSTNQDTLLNQAAPGVLGNDSDAEGTSLTAIKVSDAAHGTVILNSNGSFAYTPDGGFIGTDSFTYKASDGSLNSNIATVSITVTGVANEAPVADSQALEMAEDSAKEITLTATDGDGDALSYIIVGQPSQGTLSGTAPVVIYTPAANYHGSDSFTFKANDTKSDSNIATVSITVTPVNDGPVADDQAVTTSEDTAIDIKLVASDVEGDALTYSVITPPAQGTLSGSAPDLTYTPDSGYAGVDSFTYKANDGTLDSNIATVSITVNAVNAAPSAADDSYSTDEDSVLTIGAPGVLANDSDIDNDPLSAVLASGPSRGSLDLNADGSFSYTPAANYYGLDSFTYYASDGNVNSAAAVVTISVNSVN